MKEGREQASKRTISSFQLVIPRRRYPSIVHQRPIRRIQIDDIRSARKEGRESRTMSAIKYSMISKQIDRSSVEYSLLGHRFRVPKLIPLHSLTVLQHCMLLRRRWMINRDIRNLSSVEMNKQSNQLLLRLQIQTKGQRQNVSKGLRSDHGQ